MATDETAAKIAIPPVSWQKYKWAQRAPQMYSRAEVRKQTGVYEAAVPAIINTWNPSLPANVLTDIEDATRKLVEFDKYVQVRLASDSPSLGPMMAILLRTEAASSSQIEQLTTSAKQLALAEIAEGEKSNALSVVGNVRAMEAALDLSEDISVETIFAMHKALMRQQAGFEQELAGRFREEQVWIGPGSAGPLAADFVAPHYELVAGAVNDLIDFMQRDDLPILLQAAIAHAQFETIHPFVDGNGRVGRALTQLMLRNKGLVKTTTVPISAGLLAQTGRYFAALGSFREGDATPIIAQFAQASRFAAVTGAELVDSLVAELSDSRAKLVGVRSDAAVWRVLPELIKQPVVNTAYLADRLGLGEMTALRALETMLQRGVLVEISGKSRGRVWQHSGILGALDGYAAKTRRIASGG